jgi:MOSC domain-containing protein
VQVDALYIYPVKACGALAVDSAALGPLGLQHDRRFAFVDQDGQALTQRKHPLLATVQPTLDAQALRLDFGGLLKLAVRLADFSESATVDVWSKRIAAQAAPESLVAEAAEYLGTRLRLVALDPAARRGFVDSEPVLVTTTAMLSSLNERLAREVGMERFRPNVVIEGAPMQHGEARWRELHAKHAVLEYARPCGRCEVTTIDQASGARCGDEPLRTLNELFAGNFGVYCRVVRAGWLRRGEALQAV